MEANKKESELKIESLKDLLRKAKFTIDKQKADIVSKVLKYLSDEENSLLYFEIESSNRRTQSQAFRIRSSVLKISSWRQKVQ